MARKPKAFAEAGYSETDLIEAFRPGTAVKKHKGAISKVPSTSALGYMNTPKSLVRHQARLDAGVGLKDMHNPKAKPSRAYKGVPFVRTYDVAHERPSHQGVDSCANRNSYHNFAHQMSELGISNQLRGMRDYYYVQPRHSLTSTGPRRVLITDTERKRRRVSPKVKTIIKIIHEKEKPVIT